MSLEPLRDALLAERAGACCALPRRGARSRAAQARRGPHGRRDARPACAGDAEDDARRERARARRPPAGGAARRCCRPAARPTRRSAAVPRADRSGCARRPATRPCSTAWSARRARGSARRPVERDPPGGGVRRPGRRVAASTTRSPRSHGAALERRSAPRRPDCGRERRRIVRVNGSVVEAVGLARRRHARARRRSAPAPPGEVWRWRETARPSRSYEYTGGAAPGRARRRAAGDPLTAELGPGLLGGIFDGMLRPLARAPALPRGRRRRPARSPPTREWPLSPTAARGGRAQPGHARSATVRRDAGASSTGCSCPPGVAGVVEWIADGRAPTGATPPSRVSAASS